ncbi:hypothetical protein RyT2_17250 [Pseudolactococcus yaeyamensis]
MDVVNELSKDLGTYNPDVFKWVTNILTTSTLQTGLYIMGIIFILEIADMYEQANTANGGVMTVKMFQNLAFKFSFAGLMVSGSTIIMQFILLISNGLTSLIGVNSGGALNILTNILPKVVAPPGTGIAGSVLAIITNPDKLILSMVLWVVGIVVQLVAYILIWVILYLRFFEMYLLFVFSPIPMASFASKKYQNIGENYLKVFAAYAFQSSVILVVMGIYSIFAKTAITIEIPKNGILSTGDGLTGFLAGIVYALVFLVTLVRTLSVSKRFFGVGM